MQGDRAAPMRCSNIPVRLEQCREADEELVLQAREEQIYTRRDQVYPFETCAPR